MKKENYRKQDVTVSNLAQNKNVSLPLSFFFNKCSISKLTSLFLSEMFKLVISDYEFIGRGSFITNFENRSG